MDYVAAVRAMLRGLIWQTQRLKSKNSNKIKKEETKMADLNFQTCPKCKRGYLRAIGERTGGFSGGKALLGAVIAGPIGLAAGALGKKKVQYQCQTCGYIVEG